MPDILPEEKQNKTLSAEEIVNEITDRARKAGLIREGEEVKVKITKGSPVLYGQSVNGKKIDKLTGDVDNLRKISLALENPQEFAKKYPRTSINITINGESVYKISKGKLERNELGISQSDTLQDFQSAQNNPVEDLQKNLANGDRLTIEKIQQLLERLEDHEGRLEALEGGHDKLERDLSEVDGDRASLSSRVRKTEQTVKLLEQDGENLIDRQSESDKNNANLQARVSQLEQEKAGLGDRISQLEEKNAKLEKALQDNTRQSKPIKERVGSWLANVTRSVAKGAREVLAGKNDWLNQKTAQGIDFAAQKAREILTTPIGEKVTEAAIGGLAAGLGWAADKMEGRENQQQQAVESQNLAEGGVSEPVESEAIAQSAVEVKSKETPEIVESPIEVNRANEVPSQVVEEGRETQQQQAVESQNLAEGGVSEQVESEPIAQKAVDVKSAVKTEETSEILASRIEFNPVSDLPSKVAEEGRETQQPQPLESQGLPEERVSEQIEPEAIAQSAVEVKSKETREIVESPIEVNPANEVPSQVVEEGRENQQQQAVESQNLAEGGVSEPVEPEAIAQSAVEVKSAVIKEETPEIVASRTEVNPVNDLPSQVVKELELKSTQTQELANSEVSSDTENLRSKYESYANRIDVNVSLGYQVDRGIDRETLIAATILKSEDKLQVYDILRQGDGYRERENPSHFSYVPNTEENQRLLQLTVDRARDTLFREKYEEIAAKVDSQFPPQDRREREMAIAQEAMKLPKSLGASQHFGILEQGDLYLADRKTSIQKANTNLKGLFSDARHRQEYEHYSEQLNNRVLSSTVDKETLIATAAMKGSNGDEERVRKVMAQGDKFKEESGRDLNLARQTLERRIETAKNLAVKQTTTHTSQAKSSPATKQVPR